LAATELSLKSYEQVIVEKKSARDTLDQRLKELGIATSDDRSQVVAVDKAIAGAETIIHSLTELQRSGESLSLRLGQSVALTAIAELRREAEALSRQIAERGKDVSARTETGEQAQRVIEALREAGLAVVEERLRDINALLQSIYSRIDPHPTFRMVSFLSSIVRGKGQLTTMVADPIGEKQSEVPAAVLSSSQINALAVAVFLALNLGVSKPQLEIAILDDPLQSLDDINLLGLVDLLRRAKDQRQLFVSTHDGRFGNLLSRKLRPSNDTGRTIVIELEGWSRQGPKVATRQVEGDPVPLRLVSSGQK